MDAFVAVAPAGHRPIAAWLHGVDFKRNLKVIIAEEMTTASNPVVPSKVDIVDVRPLYSSDTKKLVLYLYGYPVPDRMKNLPERRANVIRRVKELLNLPENEQCVSFSFRRVEEGDWGKG